uniref:Uncharacterized protein n=1 Tax=Anguilla anguilla TaxID=7936 RepID=A0A0E9VPP5_ANGAN
MVLIYKSWTDLSLHSFLKCDMTYSQLVLPRAVSSG